MNRQDRAAIWQDETAHPCSPTTYHALIASEADPDLIAEWQDLEGQDQNGASSSDWMTYADFLRGAIGITEDHGPDEFDDPDYHASRCARMLHLWEELGKVTNEKHNILGETQLELQLRESLQANRKIRQEMKEPEPEPEPVQHKAIISITGMLYAYYEYTSAEGEESEFGQVISWGFMPAASDAGYFGPSAIFQEEDHSNPNHPPTPQGHDDAYELAVEPFWEAVRKYLDNTTQISGEPSFAVVWEEDGWRVLE